MEIMATFSRIKEGGYRHLVTMRRGRNTLRNLRRFWSLKRSALFRFTHTVCLARAEMTNDTRWLPATTRVALSLVQYQELWDHLGDG